MLPSCALCQRSDPQRMIALMALWFGRVAGLPSDGGYFYLCPRCYGEIVEPHLAEVLDRLVEQHPFLHRLRPSHEGMPLRQAGASPVPHAPAPHDVPAEATRTAPDAPVPHAPAPHDVPAAATRTTPDVPAPPGTPAAVAAPPPRPGAGAVAVPAPPEAVPPPPGAAA